DVEDHVSPKAKSMKMLQQELINNPCKRTQPKLREDQSLSDVNYSRKVLRSVIVSATKQPYRKNPDRYEKFVDERNKMQKRLYFPEREVRQSYFPYVPSGGVVSARSHEAASSQEMMLHVSEIVNMKQKLQQLDNQINQAKHLKKQKVGELKSSVQSGELQQQHDDTESSIIQVTNVNYAASEEAISMLFSKWGAVKNITIVTDPTAFVTFATKESVNKAIALSGTMFFSRPIKVHFSSSMCLDPYSDTNLFVFQLFQVLGVTHDNV
ncbi:unnamed protein product, partial [Brassica napus]